MIRTAAILALLAATASAAPALRVQEPEMEVETRSFAIPETRTAKELFARADEHFAAERWAEAVAALQELSERHPGELLGRTFEVDGLRSQMPVHVGAAEAARRRLLELPDAARAAYRERYGPVASAALEAARSTLDRAALVEVARRWPLTPAAVEAWWTLGDLELELGNALGAASTWRRAEELRALLDEPTTPGTDRRVDLAGALLDGGDGDLADLARQGRGASLRSPVASAAGSPPSPEGHSWRVEIDVDGQAPFNGQRRSPDQFNMFPVLAGDTLLVSTSLRLLAVDAYAGVLRWVSDEPPGWDAVDAGEGKSLASGKDDTELIRRDFFSGLDRDTLLVAPAAGSGVAVAALQIPVTHLSNREFQNIRITTVIPDRRLFAYDLETGAPLWDHMPPTLWDGESGTFPQRMRVAGPPVVVGSRVLVPAYRMRGRIDYHVACYDLPTGELLWSRAVISGQRELNMFGRHQWEFAAPPLLVEGDRVVALTGLGAVAALDLYTGDLLWETLYEQIALPQVRQFEAHRRKRNWRNAPPVAVDGVVVATPVDSEDMIALDLDTGATLWSVRHDALMRSRSREQLTLIGADSTSVYLAGRQIIACRQPAGLGSRRPPDTKDESRVLYQAGEMNYGALPRPTLTADHVVVPTRQRRVVLDRRDLGYEDPRLSMAWRDGQMAGNVLIDAAAQFCLTGSYATGTFDWDDLEQRLEAELARDPDDADAISNYASFLANRGSERLRARSVDEALRTLGRARELLEPLLEEGDGTRGPPPPNAAERLHHVLRLEAEAFVQSVEIGRALERLRRARGLAPDRFALRDTLLLEIELLEQRTDTAGWLEALAALEESCGDMLLRVPREPRSADPSAELDEAADAEVLPTMPVGLWVLLERQEFFRTEHRRGEELEALHAILAVYGEQDLGPRGNVADRIGALIRGGATGEYAPFEQRARRLLDAALESGDLEQLARIPALYPHSESARRASDALVAFAFERGDVATLAEVVRRELPSVWHPRDATPRQVELLLRLGAVLEDAGNPTYAAGLLRSLSTYHPTARSPLERHAGLALAELEARLPAAPAVPDVAAEFDETARLVASRAERFAYLGVAADAAGAPLLLHASAKGFAAFEPAGAVAWEHEAAFELGAQIWEGRHHLEPGRLTALVRTDLLVGLDTADGRELWQWQPPVGRITHVGGSGGLAVVFVDRREEGPRLHGLDTATGTVLWERTVPHEGWMWAVCGEDRVAVLPQAYGSTRVLVLDLYTGCERSAFELPGNVKSPNHKSAWIERGRLIVPHFRSWRGEHHYLAAYDLESGLATWHVPSEEGLELDSIARCDDRTYLVLLASTRERAGGLVEVHTRDGAVRPVPGVAFEGIDVPVGLTRYATTELDAPFLFAATRDAGDWLRIRAIHLPYGERWAHRVLVPGLSEENNPVPMPRPALSRTTAAFAYTEPSQRSARRGTTHLVFLDRSSGVRREVRVLAPELGEADEITLSAAGDALFLAGRRMLHVLEVER